MRKTRAALAIAALATAMLSAATTSAQARGDGWEKISDADPYTSHDCGTTLTFTQVVNREWQRITTDADGTMHIQITGAYKWRVTTKDGRTAMINASGPSFSTLTDAGVYTFDARGLNSLTLHPHAQRILGLPQDAVVAGPVTIRVGADGSLTLLQAPAHVWSVCDFLR